MRRELLQQLFKNCDDTGIDKRSRHTKQILAELIQPGSRTKHYEIHDIINSIWNREEKTQQKKELISVPILQERLWPRCCHY